VDHLMRTRLTRLETYVLGHTMMAVLGALSIIMPMQHEPSVDALRRVLPLLQETAQSMRNLI
jgi:hypothetical protein